ncbi:hypothetical protein [Kineosporia sp. R_H_3]|uniref:hypothetical protein n=1 Tax=Kineosporia sp. R_H_3 TaxID=1961848 RepID=UPI000B4BD8E0|nr:hypothetical protein [Kineosporia sp. R_H_3]
MDETHPGRAAVPPLTPYAGLPEWARRRESGHRLLAEAWTASAVLCVVLALTWERLLALPALFTLATGATWLWGAVRTRWWRARRRAARHPVVRAGIGRSTARGRPQPDGWPETVVMGAVHVTEHGWRWVPSLFCTDEVSPRGWRHSEIIGLRFVPSWSPGLPRSGYVRLLRTNGGPVDLLVWDPDLLGLLEPLPDDVHAATEHRTH